MNRNDFTGFISGNKFAGESDIPGVKDLITLYPWFHSAHLVLLKALKDASDIRFDSQLHESAMYVADRSVLYSFLYLSSNQNDSDIVSEAEKEPETAIISENKPANIAEGVVIQPDVSAVPETEQTAVINPAEEEEKAENITVTEKIKEHIPEPEIVKLPPPVKKEVSVPQSDFSTRSRDELISEIEERLRELAASTNSAGSAREEERVSQPVQEQNDVRQELHQDTAQAEIDVEEIPALIAEEKEEILQESYETTGTQEESVKETGIEEQPVVLELEPDETSATVGNIETAEISEPADDDLLELEGEDNESAGSEYIIDVSSIKKEDPETPSPTDLIDRFIELNPRLARMEPAKEDAIVDLSTDSVEIKSTFITETLAKIYISQSYYSKAINIYEKLALQYPEKSAYFASRIEKIKDLIK